MADPNVLRKAITPTVMAWRDQQAPAISNEKLNDLIGRFVYLDVPWSAKEAKKAAQKHHRQAQATFSGYGRELSKKLQSLNDVLKQRPRWVPKRVWAYCASIFIDITKMQNPLA